MPEGTASAEARRPACRWGRAIRDVGGVQPGGSAEPGRGLIPAHGGQRAVTKQAQAGCVWRMGTAQQQSCPGQGSCRLGWAEERGPGSAVNILSHCGVEGRPGILHPQDSLPLHPAAILLLHTASCVGDWTHTTHSRLSSVPLPKGLLSKASFPDSGAMLLPGSFSA